jgi:PH (Pleckstrin Homology) domain-containing protein
MTREYRYFNPIPWIDYVFPVLGVAAIAAIWTFRDFLAKADEIPPSYASLYAAGLTAMLVVLWGPVWYLGFRMKDVRVFVDDAGLTYRHRSGEKRIPFAHITQLKFPSLRFLGGWVKITTRDGSIRIILALRDSVQFLQALKHGLDGEGLTDRYDRRKFFRFLQTATFCNNGFERLLSTWWNVLLAGSAAAIVTWLLGTMKASSVADLILLTGSSFVWPLLIWLGAELAMAPRIARASDEESFSVPPRDRAHERKIYRIATLVGVLIYGLAASVALAL